MWKGKMQSLVLTSTELEKSSSFISVDEGKNVKQLRILSFQFNFFHFNGYWKAGFISYLVDVFSVHIKIFVSLFFEKVFRRRKSVFIQQLAQILFHLKRLAFTSFKEAFYMAVICIGQRMIFKAVSFYTTIFHSHFTITTRAQFASSLTVCSRCQTGYIK